MRFHALWPETPVAIGRADSCQITLEDTEVSRLHARLRFSEGQWHVEDCGSTNGVLVNGRRQPATRLEGGEVVRVGATFFRYLAQGTASADCVHEVSEEGLVGGPSLAGVRRRLLSVADSDLTVLLSGATGTGKEVASRFLHQRGSRRHAPFVAVNCAAIPEEIFESVLFGHVRGAFSGAAADALGFFRAADGGTLFLDEIGELSLRGQAKLLRVLQDNVVQPVGTPRTVGVDVRVVCAVNTDLRARIAAGTFRADLFARVAEIELALPSLAARVEDIPLLVRHFARKHGGRELALEAATVDLLCGARWQHNVRQLENAARRALVEAAGASTLQPQHFVDLVAGPPAAPAPPATSPLEALLRRHHGDVARVAAELGLSRSQLYRRAARDGLRPAAYRKR